MKRFVFFVALWLTCSAVFGAHISGTVSDASGEAIGFATVSLLSRDSALLDGAMSDVDGKYSLEAAEGEYILQVSFVGYHSVARAIRVGASSLREDFTLEEATESLAEVEVRARRPLIEHSMDKVVMNVSESVFAAGNSGQELLKKAPGVMIDKDGNVSVNGKTVEVYINDRPSDMSGEQLSSFLQGLDGSTIEKIEIITNPSAKYEAAGQGGIINIKLKRNMSKGLNGSANLNYRGFYHDDFEAWKGGDFASLNLNYRGAKTYTSLRLTQGFVTHGVMYDTKTQQPTDTGKYTLQSHYLYDIKMHFDYARLSHDWYLNDKNTLGVAAGIWFFKQNFGSDSTENYSRILLDDRILQQSSEKIIQKRQQPFPTANINYTHIFNDSLDRELTLNVDYKYRYSHAPYKHSQDAFLQELNTCTDQRAHMYSTQLDFQTNFWQTGKIEAGAKWHLRTLQHDGNTDSIFANGAKRTLQDELQYREHIAALYFSIGKRFAQKVNVKAGLRGEYTHVHGDWKTADSTTTQSYFNLFPTAFLGYNPTMDWMLSTNYTRRIQRPSYYDLNPTKQYQNAHFYSQGNPSLKPSIINSAEIKASWKQYFSLSADYSYSANRIISRQNILENGDNYSTRENFGKRIYYGASLSLTEIPIIPKWEKDDERKWLNGESAWLTATFNAEVSRTINKTGESNFNDKSFYYEMYGALTAHLPADIQISTDLGYYAPWTYGYYRGSGSTWLNAGIKKYFLKRTLTLSLNMNSILVNTYRTRTLGLPKGYSSTEWQRGTDRNISIGISYNFGTHLNVRHHKSADAEESMDASPKMGL